ncbi:hypothetical protein ESB00_05960 [Oleiharenicola lentus]|uniref:Glycosyltransferase RgtA/B/C/D-like domain-containing protein n=1 Tax=Oleiharenicola lentus TaxID=2508720 RepID=A0A4Q1C8Y2_9BACT|nr:glycosyltransferase family 39 protein [Oleiharenicola lentus]RXK55443.1 hypothetical protein ESB00_05960 [Oleiharenicola lentus]
MPEQPPARREGQILVGIFCVLLLGHFWLVTRSWSSGFLAGHEFRQTQTGLITHFIDRQNDFSLLYEAPIVGKPWVSVLLEVPIYQWSVVGLSRLLDLPHHVAARAISLGCFYLTLPAAFLLLGRMGLVSRTRRLFVVGLILPCPLYIFYSRAFLIDAMALMGSAWWLYAFVRMMERRRWTWFLFATFAGTLAALVKSAVYAVWLIPGAAYGAWLLWSDLRTRQWGRSADTVFWGLAGVLVPLGTLRWWITVTDPIKEAHASAWIFTSKNLVQGNWGFSDLAAGLAPKTWGILSNRWAEGIMAPWLLLTLLVAGLVALPRVRWPALGLAGVFFVSQFLFPWAYAYQDYYFYSCALFLCAAFGWMFLGALDSRLPRWVCWPLLIVPVAANLHTYFRSYYPQQVAPTDGGFSYTLAIRDYLPQDTVIIISGADWSAIIPYYAQRKALMIRAGLENDAAYLDRAFGELMDEDVAALVLVGAQRGNKAIAARAAAAFNLEREPTAIHPLAEIYCSLRYRDRFKESLRKVNNYGDIINPPLPPVTPGPQKPQAVLAAYAMSDYPKISPAPLRAYFEQGLGYVWPEPEKEKAIFAHPACDLWIKPPRGATHIEWDAGLVEEAYTREGAKTDGVELTITAIMGGAEREIFRRELDPANQPGDRGKLKLVIPHEPVPGEILRFSARPRQGSAFDWLYWARIEVK